MRSQSTLRGWRQTAAVNIWFAAQPPISMLTLATMSLQKLRSDGWLRDAMCPKPIWASRPKVENVSKAVAAAEREMNACGLQRSRSENGRLAIAQCSTAVFIPRIDLSDH